jgi:hypothetical protein
MWCEDSKADRCPENLKLKVQARLIGFEEDMKSVLTGFNRYASTLYVPQPHRCLAAALNNSQRRTRNVMCTCTSQVMTRLLIFIAEFDKSKELCYATAVKYASWVACKRMKRCCLFHWLKRLGHITAHRNIYRY